MKYGYTIIYVSSVEETLGFYKKAFGFDIKFIHESKAYGAVPLKDPEEKPWGQIVCLVRAMDGSIIELCSPM